jgi:phosphopantetheine--protein transferase-like protein
MVSVGIDIVELERFKGLLNDQCFIEKAFDEAEMQNDANIMAGKFAIKEAFFKASQIKIKNWNEIKVDIRNNKPSLYAENDSIGKSLENYTCDLSYSKDYVIGTVILKSQIR